MFTTPVSVASYFQFPSVPNDGLVYIVRLDSSLSTLNYNFVRPESTVTATGVRAHVTFKFKPQVSSLFCRRLPPPYLFPFPPLPFPPLPSPPLPSPSFPSPLLPSSALSSLPRLTSALIYMLTTAFIQKVFRFRVTFELSLNHSSSNLSLHS